MAAQVNTNIQENAQGVIGAGSVKIENLYFYGGAQLPAGPPQEIDKHVSIPPCPYPGLTYFGPGDAESFFGRDAAIGRLMAVVGRQSLTALVGASGSGKSSVVLAGLAPRLHSAGNWRFSHFRIGTELDRKPFLALARALVPLYVDSTSDTDRLKNTRQLAASIASGDLTLRDVFAECLNRNRGKRILLIADQFEEVFSIVEDETVRHRFIDILLAGFLKLACDNRSAVHLILTLRGDFYGQTLGYRPFADALQGNVENLGPMDRLELEEAIVRPAEKENVSYEPGLVETLLDNVGTKPGNLPLLQFALREMWGRQKKRRITRKCYDDIGGVQGALTQRAEAIFEALSDNGANLQMERAFQRLFTRLVSLGEGAEDTRRVVDRRELDDDVWSLAQRLADEGNRLVVTNALASSHQTVEVAHEALIRHWPRLASWINRDRAFLSWQRQIKPNVDLWTTNYTDEGSLLRGGMLVQAEEWLATRGNDLSPAEKRFVQASLALQKRQSLERILLEGMMRLFEVSDLTDQTNLDGARIRKLREFIDLFPAAGLPLRNKAVVMYGEALGLDATIVSRHLSQDEANEKADAAEARVPRRRTAIIASAGARNVAFLDPGGQGTAFGRYLNEALAGGAADDHGIVSLRGAFDYVQEHMRSEERQQIPLLNMQGDIGHFPLTARSLSLLQDHGKRRALLVAPDDVSGRGWGIGDNLSHVTQILHDHGGFEISLLVGDDIVSNTIIEKLRYLGDETAPDDCLLFYFAGHANVVNDRNLGLMLSSNDTATMLDFRELSSSLVQLVDGTFIMVLDTCFAGSAVSALM